MFFTCVEPLFLFVLRTFKKTVADGCFCFCSPLRLYHEDSKDPMFKARHAKVLEMDGEKPSYLQSVIQRILEHCFIFLVCSCFIGLCFVVFFCMYF